MLATVILTLAAAAPCLAAEAGKITAAEGTVELLKKGQLPVTPLKVGDGVEPKDVIRTRFDSRAQVKFIDDTSMTIGPESRVAIEEFMYDGKKNQRNAVFQVFRGLVHTVVEKVINVEEPDFVVKTHTGILGVRGTGFFVQLALLHTDLFVEKGKISAKNAFLEVKGEVTVGAMHFSRIGVGVPPTLPMSISEQEIKGLQNRIHQKAGGQAGSGGAGGSSQQVAAAAPAPAPSGTGGSGGNLSVGPGLQLVGLGTGQGNVGGGVAEGPSGAAGTDSANAVSASAGSAAPVIPTPIPSVTLTFSQEYSGAYNKTSSGATNPPFSQATYYSPTGTSGYGTRTGAYPGSFTASFSFLAIANETVFSPQSSGDFTAQMAGTVQGVKGADLTGKGITLTATSAGGTNFSITGDVKISPNGSLVFTPTSGTFTLSSVTGKIDPLASTWSQTPITETTLPASPSLAGSKALSRISRPNPFQFASLNRVRKR
jgi:hypothetical protein